MTSHELESKAPPRSQRRAALSIVGLGAVTGYGFGADALVKGMESSISAVTVSPELSEHFGGRAYAALVTAEAPEGTIGAGRYQRALAAVVDEAVADATSRGWVPGSTVALVNGIVLADVDSAVAFYQKGEERWRLRRYLEMMPSTAMNNVMQQHGWHGPLMCVTSMCASGNTALLTAAGLLASGAATDVIVAATDLSAYAAHLELFAQMGVLFWDRPAFEVCRPYQADSGGYVFGEGAAAFVCTSRPEGAYAHLLGGAQSADGFHATSIDMSLEGLRRCWAAAFANASVDPSEVAYLNGHGPGTRQSDGAEAALFEELLSSEARAYSLKPLVGHCQGAAAAVEIAAMCRAYEAHRLPAPPLFGPTPIPVFDGPSPMAPGITIKSSIGLGGHNTLTVFAPGEWEVSPR